MALAGEALQHEFSTLALGADRDRHRGGAGDIFLNQRIPLAAGLALTLPAVIRGAAVLADEGESGFGHGVSRWFDQLAAIHSMETEAASVIR